MLPQLLPHYSVGPFFGFAINAMMTLLCSATLLLYSRYRPLRSLLFFYLSSALFFLGWVIYGLQKSPQSILLGYRLDLAFLALLPAAWTWFQSSIFDEKINSLSWIIIAISVILSLSAILGKGPIFLGLPLEPHEIAPGILRPQSKILRPSIHFYCLAACLYYFIKTILKINKRVKQKHMYLISFAIGMILWFSGGLHDAVRSAGFWVPIKGQILWFTSFWLSVFLTLTVGLHFKSIDQALREAKDVFEKFVPPAYLKRIASEGLGAIKLGEADRQLLTVLCCDIRGFTALSETLNPGELITFMNRLYQKIAKAIDDYEGVIDKFMGDGFLSIFEGENSAENAVKSGIQIISVVKEFNAQSSYPSIQIGIGIHMGEVILGTLGSRQRMDSTIIGSPVNIVKRLEETSKLLGLNMIISEEIVLHLPQNRYRIRRLGEILIAGTKDRIAISEVYDNDPIEIRDLKDQISPLIVEGLNYFKSGLLDLASSKFEEAKRILPQDEAIDLIINSLKKTSKKDETKTKITIGLGLFHKNNA